MATFWEYFSVLAPSVGLGLIFWLVMRSLFRADTGERNARAELEEREAEEWARTRAPQRNRGDADGGNRGVAGAERGAAGGDRGAAEGDRRAAGGPDRNERDAGPTTAS